MNEPTAYQQNWPTITVVVAWFVREWHQNNLNFSALQTYCDGRTNGLLPFVFHLIFGKPVVANNATTPISPGAIAGGVNQETKN